MGMVLPTACPRGCWIFAGETEDTEARASMSFCQYGTSFGPKMSRPPASFSQLPKAFPVFVNFTHGPKRLTFYFQVLWAIEFWDGIFQKCIFFQGNRHFLCLGLTRTPKHMGIWRGWVIFVATVTLALWQRYFLWGALLAELAAFLSVDSWQLRSLQIARLVLLH